MTTHDLGRWSAPRPVAPAVAVGAALALAMLAAATAAAQRAPQPTTAHAEPAAAAALASAREAQAAFERRRRALLPVSHAGGRCDVQIGRWCYWYDEREPDVPREPLAIVAARERLVAALGDAAARAPRDAWIAGQRVRYLVESGRADEAAAAARDCLADRARCAALLGYALHRAGDAGGAERAFDDALAAMHPDTACRWLDPRPLVPRDDRAAFEPACADAGTHVARFWRLATPFLLRDGNDRRNEHLARHTLARMLADAQSPYGGRWSDDLEELTVRYGWPDRWSRRASPPHSTVPPEAVGHEPWPAYRFTPDVQTLSDLRAEAPSIRDPRALERAAYPGASRIAEVTLVASAFRRGDSLLVVAVAPPIPDSVLAAYDSATLVVVPLEAGSRAAGSRAAGRVSLAPAIVAASVTAPAVPGLVGLEALRDSSMALRARAAVEPPPTDGTFGVSDLLVFAADAEASVPTSLGEAMRTALPDRVDAGTTVGVFWEIYGLAAGAQAVETTVYVETPPPGWLARLVARVARREPSTPPRLRWTDVGAGGAVASRAVLLDAALLAPGRHELVLELRRADGRTVRTRRTVHVTGR